MANSKLPRGIRCNNPGNIRISKSKWQGKIPVEKNTDGAFEQFKAPEWGIRAIAMIILGYQENRGADTLQKVFAIYAPTNENDTGAYINYVANKSGIKATDTLDFDSFEVMAPVVRAIIGMENGEKYYDYYSDDVIKEGLKLAGIHGTPPKPVIKTGEAKAAAASTAVATVALAGQAIQAVQPALPLAQQVITAAPWIIGVITVCVLAYIGFNLYKKYKAEKL